MDQNQQIIQKKGLLGGKPTIKGTRISVDHIATYLTHGYGVKDIKEAYPSLTDTQIQAAFDYLDEKVHKERKKLEPTSV